MNAMDFEYLRQFIKTRSGISLSEDKIYLIESRLAPVARRHGIRTIEDVVMALRRNTIAELPHEVTDAMTTNESSFFRDSKPFERFREETLPSLLQSRAGKKSIRIWCAAASSGQEPYSLAMILKEESQKLFGWNCEIVATDISHQILEQAKSGRYTQFEVQRGLPIELLTKYFTKTGDYWNINPEIRSMVSFRKFNLLDSPSALGRFDVVFCRNVLIYFEKDTKAEILSRICRVMPDDGVLVLGGAETVIGVSDSFQVMPGRGSYYAPNNQQPIASIPTPESLNRSKPCLSIPI